MADNKKNTNDGFASGVLLIVIGVVALCVILFDIHIVWSVMSKLWPLILILIGVCVLPIDKWIRTGLVGLLLLCGVLGYHFMEKNYYENHETYIAYNDDWDDYDESVISQDDSSSDGDNTFYQEFSEPYKFEVTEAEVEVDYGAGNMKIGSPTTELVFATNTSKYMRQSFNVIYDDNNEADIKFTTEGNIDKKVKKNDGSFNMSLNTNPVWSIDLNLGACKFDADFSNYKVKELNFDGGVCDVDMKIGTLYDKTEIEINTGVSNIIIRIPETAGCRIESESALSSKSFEGMSKIERGVYQTSNYGEAQQTIDIELTCGVSDITVKRY